MKDNKSIKIDTGKILDHIDKLESLAADLSEMIRKHIPKIESQDIKDMLFQFVVRASSILGTSAELEEDLNNLIKIHLLLDDYSQQLEKAKEETDLIMDNVDDGLFLLDPSFSLGSQYSKSLSSILRKENTKNKQFLKVLGKMLPDQLMELIKDYLKLLFSRPELDTYTLKALNPLNEIEVNSQNSNDSLVKYLQFSFHPIKKNNHVVRLLGIIRDNTKQNLLAKNLEATKVKNQIRMQALSDILNINKSSLNFFLEDFEEKLKDLEIIIDYIPNHTLNDPKAEGLETIFNLVHTIKGNAICLGLRFIANEAHECETKIIVLQNKPTLQEEDLDSINDIYNQLKITAEEVRKTIDQLSIMQKTFGEEADKRLLLLKQIEKTIKRLSKDYNKSVTFYYNSFNHKNLIDQHIKPFNNILTQLIRNCIIHGIETEEERKSCGKTPNGRIELISDTTSQKNYFTFKLKDDGRGIEINKLREKAITLGKWSKQEISNWDDKQLVKLIFQSQFSTSQEADMLSGRGIGMNIVKKTVEKCKGAIEVCYEKGKFCEFSISLPTHSQ